MPFLLFLVLPLAELWLLIRVGAAIGALTVVAWVVAAAALGVAVIQRQGFNMLTQVRARLARGEPPAEAMLDGMLLALSGLLLVVPGLLTDGAGLLGLVPTLRRWLVRRLLAAPRVVRRGAGSFIEGDYERED